MESRSQVSVSLIIPIYNVAPYIERCLKSVMSQTYDHFECILVDDASPDESVEICERMISEYRGNIAFRVLHHSQNKGLSAARNTGTKAASGDYVLYVDSDDLISNDCVEKLVEPVSKDPSIEMVLGQVMRYTDEGGFDQKHYYCRREEDVTSPRNVRDLYLNRKHPFPSAAWNKLISKAFIERHNLHFKEGQLWEEILWTYFVMKHLGHLYIIPDITYFYCIREGSICKGSKEEELNKHKCEVFNLISKNLTPGEEDQESALFAKDFSHSFIRQPRTLQNLATACRFSKVMPAEKYPIEKKLLKAACLTPRTAKGRDAFFKYEKRLRALSPLSTAEVTQRR